jgi:hypothetical protein
MKRIVLFGTICLALVFAVNAAADTLPVRAKGNFGMLHGEALNSMAKSEGDTIYLLGGPNRLDGKFQDAAGQPNWQGWTSEDLTFSEDEFWSVTDEEELVIAGNFSAWCGTVYPEPGPIPVPGFGYGNSWSQSLVFTHTVANPGLQSNVVWAMKLQYDTEPGYDYVDLDWNRAGQWITLQRYDGDSADVATPPNTYVDVSHSFLVRSDDYAGPGANQIQIRVRFTSDGAWSDQDGLWPTNRGACQVDDITVTVNGSLVNSENFESGTFGAWVQILDTGVGDFAALYSNLGDLDPCRTNFTPQVAFIDDGIVVPGTGGTLCITWCYGPGGYIVNNTGGLEGPDFHINNLVKSPVIPWPTDVVRDAIYLDYEVYRHEELGDFSVWPGMFYQWHIRSINTGDPADIETAPWRNRNFVYYGGPNYIRSREVVSDLLAENRTHVQISLRVIEYGWVWGWVGVDGTSAPYFDNVALVAYPIAGPSITTREIDIAQDNFPTIEVIDYANLGVNHVRFDMARNVAPIAHLNNYPGDTIIFDVVAVRAGTELADMPKMHVKMKANPLFDSFRQLPAGFTLTTDALPGGWGLIEGVVDGLETFNAAGNLVPDRYNFDLPDEFFFYPGDVIHYYIEAEDTGGGITTSPGNLDAFGNFDHNLQFSSSFIVRALPTMFSGTPGDQPRLLFWNDFANRGLENEWQYALRNIGYLEGVDYDLYYTNGPSSGVGNGLGGRATEFHLAEYDVLLYSVGDLSVSTLSNGDFNFDAGNDIGVVSAWLEGETVGKKALFTGNDLVFSLNGSGAAGQAFIFDFFRVSFQSKDIRPFIGGQTSPLVRAIPNNGVIERVSEWVAYGGCPGIASFDAYNVVAPAVRLAEFTNPAGQGGAYTYAAASHFINPDLNFAEVVLMPYDLGVILNAPGWTPPPGYAGVAARAIILEDILEVFGQTGSSGPTSVTPDAVFAVSNFPNPFNPATTIKLNLPRTGDVSLKVFNVRGELVRTLVNGQLEAGLHDIVWDGTTNGGNQAASGVYFYETRYGSEVKVNKMALVK